MKKLSNIISSVVISIYDAKEVGIVYNITLDEKTKKCKYMCILNEENDITSVIRFKDIFSIGNDCIYIKNKEIVELQNNLDNDIEYCKTLLNLKVYDILGNYLGVCQDIEIDDNYQATNIITSNNNTIHIKHILNTGAVIITGNKKIAISKFKPNNNIKISSNKPIEKVAILNSKKTTPPATNSKVVTDSNFLLGRKITKDITTHNGEILAKSGSIINKETVYKLGLYGKIIELSRHSTKA